MRRAAPWVALALAPACAHEPPRRAIPVAPVSVAPVPVAQRSPRAPPRALRVALSFDERGLHARVAATGPAAELAEWSLAPGVERGLEVEDADGSAVPFSRAPIAITLDARGAVTLRYDVNAEASSDDPRATVVEAARFRASGERLFAIPRAWLGARPERRPAVSLAIDASAVDAPVVASTFGAGSRALAVDVDAAPDALLRATFVAGGGGRAMFDAPEGHDEAAWIGFTAFDPRAVSAEVAGFRSLLHEYFFGKESRRSTLFFYVDARAPGRYRAARVADGIVVALAGRDAYDAPLRLTVATELVHAWIGERIWLGDRTPGKEPEGWWFHEGVARWIAREQLVRAGLLGPSELADEVDRLLAVLASPRAKKTMAELVADPRATGALPVLVARGALFATAIDQRIREASRGTRSFDDVVRVLAKRAEDRPVAVTREAFLAAVGEWIGEASAKQELDAWILQGTARRLSDGALGACFAARAATYEMADPGFDRERSTDVLVGVDPKGAAARAGLREGDRIVARTPFENAREPGVVVVDRAGQRVSVKVVPAVVKLRGQRFEKQPGLSDDACRKLFFRK